MARMYEDTVLLSSEISDVPEKLSDTETDDSNNNPDLEFETFSHRKIIKRRIMESDKDNDALTSSSESVILSSNSTKSLTQDSTAKKIKRKEILSLFDEAETSNTFKKPKSHNDYTRNNEFTQIIANACYEQVKTLIQKKMDNIKRSILCDMRKSFEELKNNLLLNLLPKDKINTISTLKQIIEIKIPTSTLDEFKTLDALMEIDEKKDALRTLFEKYVYVTPTHKKAIHNTLSAVMDKEVQILFTAFGRRSESKKLNFNKTKIYSLLMDILISKFGTEEEKEINSSMSRWFTIAADRKGGRKEKGNLDKITNSN
ncbi:uncharacterized protein [Anoplolepis gracilipes]|uniref:uncharacterized protein n=1 Tax=Anoplolepis gracilipes TaxID=354296 RepID=UPI003B9FBD5C